MDIARFEALIHRLERRAQESPRTYLLQVAATALLGFGILAVTVGFSLLLILALVGFIAALFAGLGAGTALVIAKLGKFVIVLAIPLWLMIRISLKMLFTRFEKPHGRELSPRDAPALFARLDELRQRMKGPAFHHVLLTDDMNAAMVQHPLFGLFGWNRNYLILGMPLLQALDENEALAVVAHEYGHLAGNHGHFGAFIYRLRNTWARIDEAAAAWNDWASKLVGRLFRWYAPYFNAYSFVLARANEYEADRSSAELVGAQATASALMRFNIAAQFRVNDFWPGVFRRVEAEAGPVAPVSREWKQALGERLDADRQQRYLGGALGTVTDYADTHPALVDRLKAIGVSEPDKLAPLPEVEASAAYAWLGATLETLQDELDAGWRKRIEDDWRERHQYLARKRLRLRELAALPQPALEEEWEKIEILGELEPEQDAVPLLQALLERKPDHVSALYRRGCIMLERGDEAGIADLEAVMARDAYATLGCCEAAFRFYRERDPGKAESYRSRWEARSEVEKAIQAEMDNVRPSARLAPAELPDQVVAEVTRHAQTCKRYIKRAYLVRRLIESDPGREAYVLGFELRMFWGLFASTAPTVIDRLAALQYPMALHIVNLGNNAYKPFLKQIRAFHSTALKL